MNKVVKAENEKIAAIDFATATETMADGQKRAEIKKAEGIRQAEILKAEGEAQAIKLVNEAADQYFVGNAQLLRKLCRPSRRRSGRTPRSSFRRTASWSTSSATSRASLPCRSSRRSPIPRRGSRSRREGRTHPERGGPGAMSPRPAPFFVRVRRVYSHLGGPYHGGFARPMCGGPLSSRKHTTRLVLLAAPLLLGLTALSVSMMPGGSAGPSLPALHRRPSPSLQAVPLRPPRRRPRPAAPPRRRRRPPARPSHRRPGRQPLRIAGAGRRFNLARGADRRPRRDPGPCRRRHGRVRPRLLRGAGRTRVLPHVDGLDPLRGVLAHRRDDRDGRGRGRPLGQPCLRPHGRRARPRCRAPMGRELDGPPPLQRRRHVDGPRLRPGLHDHRRPPPARCSQAQLRRRVRTRLECRFGGGLWWTTDRTEKNACVNAPAAIAAVRLAGALHQPAYLAKAKRLYAWLRRQPLRQPDRGCLRPRISRRRADGGRPGDVHLQPGHVRGRE